MAPEDNLADLLAKAVDARAVEKHIAGIGAGAELMDTFLLHRVRNQTDAIKSLKKNTSNVRCAVDREFVYLGLVPRDTLTGAEQP